MADPLYQRIANDLRTQIEGGQLQPGAQLPPEEQLGKLFKASRNTIRDAIKFLISLGLVETRAGQGTFVVDPPDPLVTKLTSDSPGLGGGEGAAYLSEASERHPRSDIPTVELQTALGEIAYRLGVPEGTPVVSLARAALYPVQAGQSANRAGQRRDSLVAADLVLSPSLRDNRRRRALARQREHRRGHG